MLSRYGVPGLLITAACLSVGFFIDEKPQTKLLPTKDKNGNTVLHNLIINCQYRLVLNGIKEIKDDFSILCDQWAMNDYSFTELNNDGDSILHLAAGCAGNNEFTLIKYILESVKKYKRKIDLDVLDEKGATAFFHAIRLGCWQSAICLIKAGADFVCGLNGNEPLEKFTKDYPEHWRIFEKFYNGCHRPPLYPEDKIKEELVQAWKIGMLQLNELRDLILDSLKDKEDKLLTVLNKHLTKDTSGVVSGYVGFFRPSRDDRELNKGLLAKIELKHVISRLNYL